jgi:hypothetical protein
MNSTITVSATNIAMSALCAAALRPGGAVCRSLYAVFHSVVFRRVRGVSTVEALD